MCFLGRVHRYTARGDPRHQGGEGVAGTPGACSQVFCHPIQCMPVMRYRQRYVINTQSEPPPPGVPLKQVDFQVELWCKPKRVTWLMSLALQPRRGGDTSSCRSLQRHGDPPFLPGGHQPRRLNFPEDSHQCWWEAVGASGGRGLAAGSGSHGRLRGCRRSSSPCRACAACW